MKIIIISSETPHNRIPHLVAPNRNKSQISDFQNFQNVRLGNLRTNFSKKALSSNDGKTPAKHP